MNPLASLAALVLLAASLLPTPAVAAGGQASRLLYDARWSRGTAGWLGYGDGETWGAAHGVLTYGASGHHWSVFLAPVTTRAVPRFAVETSIRLMDTPYDGYGSFGLMARTPSHSATGDDGWFAGIYQDGSTRSSSAALWAGTAGVAALDENPKAALLHWTFDPGSGWHTYRLEVRGNAYRFLVDGHALGTGVSGKYLRGTRVGLFGWTVRVEVRSFRLFSLP